MNTTKLILSAFVVCIAVAVYAGGEYDLTWHTIDGGGGTSTGASFELSGTIGQPDAGVMSGGGFELAGGFWAGAGTATTPACLGDLNNSGAVDVQDLLILLGAWGPNPGHPADLNSSGAVDVQDLLILLGAWGPCP
ncbi:MAG TPA: hypothetical protein PK400_01430 [Phycisphaerales bacterium]|nr:hypothetical protein [Phycisphaerales bacterium]HRQ75134.1 hypothetical protein [Phycisphaerales bacterium]